MNFYEKEMREMFGNKDLLQDAKFCGKMMLAKLDEELRLKLQFVTMGYADNYEAIKATILKRDEGAVDCHIFRFSDIIGYKRKYSSEKVKPYMWEDGERSCWYTPVSTAEKQQIAQTVLEYAGMFVSPDMEIRM